MHVHKEGKGEVLKSPWQTHTLWSSAADARSTERERLSQYLEAPVFRASAGAALLEKGCESVAMYA